MNFLIIQTTKVMQTRSPSMQNTPLMSTDLLPGDHHLQWGPLTLSVRTLWLVPHDCHWHHFHISFPAPQQDLQIRIHLFHYKTTYKCLGWISSNRIWQSKGHLNIVHFWGERKCVVTPNPELTLLWASLSVCSLLITLVRRLH
jgi:hypothetical protein